MTLAGLVLETLKRIPRIGEILVVNGWRLEVTCIDNHRIERLLVSRLPGTSRVLENAHAVGRGTLGEAANGGERASGDS